MSPDPTSVSVAAMAPLAGAGYAGAERCQTCHNAEFSEFNKTHHAAIKPPQKDLVIGCEMCHGPGKAHAGAQEASQGDDAKTAAANKLIFSFHGNPRQNAERCLVCHQSSRDQKDFTHSSHIQHGVDCSSCHSMHLVESAGNPKAERIGTAQGNFLTCRSFLKRPIGSPIASSSNHNQNCVTDAMETSRRNSPFPHTIAFPKAP